MNDPASVIAVQERLKQAGVLSEREDDVECCYSRQTKFWLLDPDKNMWGTVVYKGPFRSVTDDGGREYRVGERVTVDAATAARLERGPLADQFVFLRDRSRT
jgi:hypothetical protein